MASLTEFKCQRCKDTGFILTGTGWVGKECGCLKQTKLMKRMKNAMIPEEFQDAKFDNFIVENETQRIMLEAMKAYVGNFEISKNQLPNSIGFVATFGEIRIRSVVNQTERMKLKLQHNNFGIGKTHLQIAAGKKIIERGVSTLIVSDVVLMEDLSHSRDKDEFNKLIYSVSHADLLIWDDIGKAKKSDFRYGLYYNIINERYKAKRPIIFSSNEDMETLAEQIGDASASRLFGMSKGRIYAVEGIDYRLADRSLIFT